jgi:hypothetical protein
MAKLEVLQAGLDYVRRGWSVVPLRPKDKRPLAPWEPFQHRRAGEDEVRDWLARWPGANLGIVTGAISGIVVIDVDPKHGGEESLARLVLEHGPLPLTIEARTGGGGRHLYFAHLGDRIANKVGFAPGLDLRGDGGYVVAPPSMHPSGRRYEWAAGPDETAPAPIPRWLLRLVGAGGPRTGHPLAHWRRLVREGVTEGERNSTIASLAGHLLWHGVDPSVVLDLLLAWNRARCRPPLPEAEVAQVVDSIARLHERGRQHPQAAADPDGQRTA